MHLLIISFVRLIKVFLKPVAKQVETIVNVFYTLYVTFTKCKKKTENQIIFDKLTNKQTLEVKFTQKQKMTELKTKMLKYDEENLKE